jgi:putative membrane protein
MGTEFDKAYTDFMVDDHQEDIDDFKKEAEKGNDPEVKSWAADKLSTLEHHLQMAKDAQEACKRNNSDSK